MNAWTWVVGLLIAGLGVVLLCSGWLFLVELAERHEAPLAPVAPAWGPSFIRLPSLPVPDLAFFIASAARVEWVKGSRLVYLPGCGPSVLGPWLSLLGFQVVPALPERPQTLVDSPQGAPDWIVHVLAFQELDVDRHARPYARALQTGGRLTVLVWDLDRSEMQRVWDTLESAGFVVPEAELDRLQERPEFSERFLASYQALLEGAARPVAVVLDCSYQTW